MSRNASKIACVILGMRPSGHKLIKIHEMIRSSLKKDIIMNKCGKLVDELSVLSLDVFLLDEDVIPNAKQAELVRQIKERTIKVVKLYHESEDRRRNQLMESL